MDGSKPSAFEPGTESLQSGKLGPIASAENDGGSFETVEQLLVEALVATLDPEGLPRRLASLVAAVIGAEQVILWLGGRAETALLGTTAPLSAAELAAARERAERALENGQLLHEQSAAAVTVTLPLMIAPRGVLEARFGESRQFGESELPALERLAGRIGAVLEEAEKRRELGQELVRTQALLSFAGQVIAELALEPTLNNAIERIATLLGVERIAVYLNDDGRLQTAVARGLDGPHELLAVRLLELAQASGQAPSGVIVGEALTDERLESLRDVLIETGVESISAFPLEASGETIGLLALYLPRDRIPGESEQILLEALSSQLAVAVHHARLHEHATRLSMELEHSLRAEQQAAAQLRALYEVSRAFAQSLSLQTTLEAAAKTIAELVGVDVAVLYMLDERRVTMEVRALHVADSALEEPITAVLGRSLPLTGGIARVFRDGLVLRLTPEAAGADESYHLLAPFLERGSTAVALPVATPKEVLATVSLLSLEPGRPIRDETIQAALAIVGQAALAIDNARLYEQQKAFADAMQRSLLPDYEPEIEGLDVGAAYAASARLEIGGDLYDFMVLDDGALAIALGDVTGHGVDAAADMAMVKFTFRSLVRRYPEPGTFLAAVNEVVLEEVAPAKFVTMVYLKVDPERTELACASAGHPRPRLLRADGRVEPLTVGGLALGIIGEQSYEEIRIPYAPGDAVVLYTDGVIEARRGRELYGTPRLDEFLRRNSELGARELADAVLEDCRRFAGGPLLDDCAVVVVRAR
jgi:serine phosphatase RsbU (regulator of sigma subunit)